jgi:hypothetical protein
MILLIFLTIYFCCLLSKPISFNISINSADSFANTPKVLIDKLTNFTFWYWFFCWLTVSRYLHFLRSTLLWRLDSKPTVSSSMYKHLLEMDKSKSGRRLSPVMIEGLVKPGRSTYRVELLMVMEDCRRGN